MTFTNDLHNLFSVIQIINLSIKRVWQLKKIGVLSGKGGTGKTSIAVSIARGLIEKGYKAGLLDFDLSGPNVLEMLGNHPIGVTKEDTFIPAEVAGLKYISLGHVVSKADPILWSGKDFGSAAWQLLERTEWHNLEYLICDFPPGSGAEVQKMLPLMDSVIIVTVPSHLSESNVRRCIEMCREKQIGILGLIKNMTFFQCECGKKTIIFPDDHSFEEYGIPVLAEVPLKREIAEKKMIQGLPVEDILKAKPVLLKKKRFKSRLLKFAGKMLLGD